MRQAELQAKGDAVGGSAAASPSAGGASEKPASVASKPSALKMATDAIKISDVNSTKDLPDLDAVSD